jgi:hypothetical protein
MGFLGNIKNKITKTVDAEYKKKNYLLRFLTSAEISTLEISYYGKKLMDHSTDENGIERTRVPTRAQLINAICLDIPTELILDKFPKLQKRLE